MAVLDPGGTQSHRTDQNLEPQGGIGSDGNTQVLIYKPAQNHHQAEQLPAYMRMRTASLTVSVFRW